jgi:hypothetical protein
LSIPQLTYIGKKVEFMFDRFVVKDINNDLFFMRVLLILRTNYISYVISTSRI